MWGLFGACELSERLRRCLDAIFIFRRYFRFSRARRMRISIVVQGVCVGLRQSFEVVLQRLFLVRVRDGGFYGEGRVGVQFGGRVQLVGQEGSRVCSGGRCRRVKAGGLRCSQQLTYGGSRGLAEGEIVGRVGREIEIIRLGVWIFIC